ncbi:hypothetical protein KQI69_08000 [Eubacterium sp. MSJ-13]|uniref:tetratricopeptide repeat protein n=1 Tax=Eubacterium sp. MSJ-13 TaxID=2841513 RepID=UPI001C118DC5|nr:hypothetical protein [Eubacterium sp. MSJ-13]MBU5479144.1 hypothetical protein [Eubacterium sp. MSJ-13]
MRQYELTIRIAQIHHLIEVRKYKKALAVVKTLDMRQVKGISDLSAIAEVYTKTEQFDAAKNTYLRIYKKSRTRRVLYRLIYLAIRTNALDEAEGYYQEFVAMNSNHRDALILRYRIDKASGASIGQLIEILESLKEEEYIEEWAYELAKLYFKAGRFDECRSECEDIKLWFGRGEIVDRAKRLIASIDDDEQFAYIDDRDYTVEKENPNPDDTGSLPDLTEYVESESEMKKPANSIGSKVKKVISLNLDDKSLDEGFDTFIEEDEEESEYARDKGVDALLKMDDSADGDNDEYVDAGPEDYDSENKDSDEELEEQSLDGTDTIYDEGDDDEAEDFDGAEMARKAIDGLQRLSGLWKHPSKSEPIELVNKSADEPVSEKKERPYIHHSQSGTGITQDLSKEISAIYEAEKKEQLKVHSIKVDEGYKSNTPHKVHADKTDNNSVISREDAMAPSDIEEIKNDLKDITGHILGSKKKRIIDSVADEWGNTKPIGRDIEAVNEAEKNKAANDLENDSEDKNKIDSEIISKVNTADMSDSVQSRHIIIEQDDDKKEEMSSLHKEHEDKVEDSDKKSQTEIKLDKAAKLFGINKNKTRSEEEAKMADYSIPEDELPTTRALHKTFKDVLTLINAEKDPSHFVLIGEESEKIIAVSKSIVKVLKKNGFLSQGRIGCIQAKQLNQMDFDACKEQLKGCCLLVEDAADLYFPTITKVFGLMDEFYGDFIVILADEGDTLDQMFRFAPALAKKFKYVIDISRYTEEDLK